MERRALIVDDDPVIRNLMAALLRRKSLQVVQAANGEEAITLLQASADVDIRSAFELIILDLMMPKVNGWDVLEFLRKSRPDVMSSVIIISAADEPQLQLLRDAGGCPQVLSKPFDAAHFYAIVEHCLARKPAPPADGAEMVTPC